MRCARVVVMLRVSGIMMIVNFILYAESVSQRRI